MVKFRYTDEHKAWLRANSKGVPYDELATRFNAEFGLDKTAHQIQGACHDHGAHNGIYKAGWEPQTRTANKFRRHRPVGSTRLSKDGYFVIKVAEPCHWELAHIAEWEKHHGKLDRRKNIIMFRDGDKAHWQIDNLMCVERRLIAIINGICVENGWAINADNIDTLVALAQLRSAKWGAYVDLYGTSAQYHKWRDNATPEQIAEWRKKNALGMRKYYKSMTPSQRDAYNRKQREQRRKKRIANGQRVYNTHSI